MNKMIALAKREMVENRVGMVWTPAIVMGLMLLLIVTSLVLNAGDMMLGWNSDDRPIMGLGGLLDELAQNDPQVRSGMVISFLSLMSSPALLILPFVVFFIMLGGLYEERRDRSFLFWKSMPVSDTQEVLSKIIAAAVITPAIFFLVGLAAQILALLFISLYGLAQGAAVGVLWHPGTFLLNWLHAVMVMYVWVLWALPVFAWVLFCSAYAPRAPFMYAVVPPIGLIILEGVIFKSDRLSSWIGQHLGATQMMKDLGEALSKPVSQDSGSMEAMMVVISRPDFSAMIRSFGYADFWIGLAIAAGFTAACVWLRRNNL